MNESGYTRAMGDRVKRLDSTVRVWKISDRFTRAVPDTRYSGFGGRLYIEYKWLPALPKRAPVRPALSEGQKDWLREEHARGTPVAVVVGSPQGAVLYKGLDWEQPLPAEDCLLSNRDLAEWIRSVVA